MALSYAWNTKRPPWKGRMVARFGDSSASFPGSNQVREMPSHSPTKRPRRRIASSTENLVLLIYPKLFSSPTLPSVYKTLEDRYDWRTQVGRQMFHIEIAHL